MTSKCISFCKNNTFYKDFWPKKNPFGDRFFNAMAQKMWFWGQITIVQKFYFWIVKIARKKITPTVLMILNNVAISKPW